METRLPYKIKIEEFNALRDTICSLGANPKENTFPHLKHRKTSGRPRIILKSKLTHYTTGLPSFRAAPELGVVRAFSRVWKDK